MEHWLAGWGDGSITIVGCGARTWQDCGTVATTLEGIRSQYPQLTVIEGGGRGADHCVKQWAADMRTRGVHWAHVPARWDDHGDPDKWKAGHERNQVMADMLLDARDAHGHGVAVVAFKGHLDGRLWLNAPEAKGGTEDMIRRAWDNQIHVWWRSSEQGGVRRVEANRLL